MKSIEWPTLFLLMVVYTIWIAVTLEIAGGNNWLYIFLALVITQHSSLQHEAIHGHPTKWLWLNTFLAAPAIGLLLPYGRFRDLHLKHHRNWLLTDPYEDTESNFLAERDWLQLSRWHQRLLIANSTLLGRMVLGPWIMYCRFFKSEAMLIRTGERDVIRSWAEHLAFALPVLSWLAWLDISIPVYVIAAVWPGTSLLLLRSYAEHIPARDVDDRSAIVESGPLWGVLFLYNNLHRVHHDEPRMAWYRIPEHYKRRYQNCRGDHITRSYWHIIKQHALNPRYPIAHPFLRTDIADRPK